MHGPKNRKFNNFQGDVFLFPRLLLDGNFPTKSSLKMEQTVLHFIMTAKKHKHSQNKNSFCVV